MMNRARLCGQHKKAPDVGLYNSSNELAPQLQRCQFCFSLNTVVIVVIDIFPYEQASLLISFEFNPMNTLGFENRKEIFG